MPHAPDFDELIEQDVSEGDQPNPEGEIDFDVEPIPPGYNDFSEYDPGDLKEHEDFANDNDPGDYSPFDNDF
jgi:hypothetical protein